MEVYGWEGGLSSALTDFEVSELAREGRLKSLHICSCLFY